MITNYLKSAKPLVPIKSCTEDVILAYLGKHGFRPLTPLPDKIPLVPNDRYLAFLLWSILSDQAKDQITSQYHDHPDPALHHKASHLARSKENLYWSLEDERRYPYVPPIVCSRDFKNHPWLRAFTYTARDIRQIALEQLTTLETFNKTRRDNYQFDWEGHKDFRIFDPEHCLEILPKAPPRILFRTDQDLKYSREAVTEAILIPQNRAFCSDHNKW